MPTKSSNKSINGNDSQRQRAQEPKSEQQLLLQIEKLRRQQPNTLQLYVDVARLLFFEHEIVPTTNRMYQLVRRGSMGTPAQALRIFWSQLRDESQIRMQKAALPETVLHSAEQLLGQLWDEAVDHAEKQVQEEGLQWQIQVQKWMQDLDAARQANEQLKQDQADCLEQLATQKSALQQSQQEASDWQERAQALNIELAEASARHDEQQRQWHSERSALQKQIHDLEQEIQRTEERAQAHEKRALLEIEHARQQARVRIDELSQDKQQLQLQISEIQGQYTAQSQQLAQAEQQQQQLQQQCQQAEQTCYQLRAQLQQTEQELLRYQGHIRRLEQRWQRYRQRKVRVQRGKRKD